MRPKILTLGLAVFLLLSACNLPATLPPIMAFLGTDTSTPTATPTSTATFTPTSTSTQTSTPTSTPTPTDTPTSTPTRTKTPRPTAPPAASGGSGLAGSAGGSGGSGGSGGCATVDSGFESQVVNLVNSQRAANGLSALSASGSIRASAEAWSVFMANNNVFYHSTSFPGGENIAAGYGSPSAVVDAWMNSPGHRANILNPSFTQAGAGYAYCASSEYGSYWTLQFGY